VSGDATADFAAGAVVGDVGGTHARFARVGGDGRPRDVRVLATADHADLAAALRSYLAGLGADAREVSAAAVAVACPVAGDEVHLTNAAWRFSVSATRAVLGLDRLLVLNDFEALALSLPALAAEDLETVREGVAERGAPLAVLGPGTGLGVSGLIPAGGAWRALRSEGGHQDLAATTEREWRVIQRLSDRFGRASLERALSGPGLANLYLAISAVDGRPADPLAPAEVSARARAGSCPAALEAVGLFAGFLGGAAGDLVLTLGARGGLYLGGGVLEAMGPAFDRARFVARFLAKGRFASYLEPVPVRWIRHPAPALLGAARALATETL
jgi:glucokinase